MNRLTGHQLAPVEVVDLWQRWVGRSGITGAVAEGYIDGYARRLAARSGGQDEPYRRGHVMGSFDRLRQRPIGTGLGDIEAVTEAARRPTFDPLPGAPVRWKQGAWRAGRLAEDPVGPDGTISVIDGHTGGARTLRPGVLQVPAVGPRGGRHWAWWDDVVTGRARSCELGACTDRSIDEPETGRRDDVLPACWKHASAYYAWELEPVTDPAVAVALDARPLGPPAAQPRTARPTPARQARSL